VSPAGQLYHVSEEGGIRVFEPRMPSRKVAGADRPVVWAVDGDHLCNYLLPRDCPRVTFRAGPDATAEDLEKFLGSDPGRPVVALQKSWLEAARRTVIHVYRLDPGSFRLQDRCAGYYVSDERAVPLEEMRVDDPLAAITDAGAEVWVLDSLWELREEVLHSTLDYSVIRMHNASKPDDPARFHPLP
jgi:hypothetical protein